MTAGSGATGYPTRITARDAVTKASDISATTGSTVRLHKNITFYPPR